ncbi:MAG TPA: MATE family efflux transporter [Sutterella sp.]|nr:MATE family efflux transporter [Sutterella sp.]
MSASTRTGGHGLSLPNIGLSGLARLAGPIFIANLAVMGSVTVDTIMAGRLGVEHLAAVALGGASCATIFIGLMGILQALSPIAGNHFGARNYKRIGFDTVQSGWIAVLLTIIGMTIMLNTWIWTGLGGATGKVKELTEIILVASAFGLPGALASRVFISLNAAVSRPKVTMWVSLASLALKVPVNALFMYGLFGLPELGGAGVGVATALLNTASALVYLTLFLRDPYYDKMRPERLFGPVRKAIAEHLRLGVPIGMSTFFEVSSFSLMAVFISRVGPIEVSAHQIVANIMATFYMLPLSLGISASVLVAQCLGAGSALAAREITWRTFAVATTLAVGTVLAIFLLKNQIIGLYTTDAAVTSLCLTLIVYGCIYHVFDALQTVANFAMRGYRMTFLPMLVYATLLWGVGVGGGLYLGLFGEAAGGPYGAQGFWFATALSLFLAGAVLTAMAFWVASYRAKEQPE